MNYYTWLQPKLEPILNFDWGSQSIAQSKFQRASQKGKSSKKKFSLPAVKLFFEEIAASAFSKNLFTAIA